jgi:hypothetical protein
MTRLFNRLFKRTLSHQGYTIDQTILIVAIIAILITLVIVTVGWQLINRTSGTKVASQVRQIEEANGQFFSTHRVWPHQAYTSPGVTANNNMLALAANSAITTWVSPPVDTANLRNLLEGYTVESGAINHTIGSGGAITEQPALVDAQQRMVVQFASVPYAEAAEAEKAIDNSTTPETTYNTGRVRFGTSTCFGSAGGALATQTAATSGNVFLCYVANAIQ